MLFFDVTPITTWITDNPDWSLLIVFAIAFIESLAVVGLLMPGWILLVAVGVLIGTGNINFYMASLVCFLGAVIGEYLSFLVGVHYQHRVHQWTIFKRHPSWMTHTIEFFNRYGVASIAFGRFVGPVRAFVPLLAGMSSMPALRFQIANVLSALIWAPVYLMPGVLLGASVKIDPMVRWILLSNLAAIVLSGWLLLDYLKLITKKNASTTSTEHSKEETYHLKLLYFKAGVSALALVFAMTYLLMGSQQQQLFQLATEFYQIIAH